MRTLGWAILPTGSQTYSLLFLKDCPISKYRHGCCFWFQSYVISMAVNWICPSLQTRVGGRSVEGRTKKICSRAAVGFHSPPELLMQPLFLVAQIPFSTSARPLISTSNWIFIWSSGRSRNPRPHRSLKSKLAQLKKWLHYEGGKPMISDLWPSFYFDFWQRSGIRGRTEV